MQPPISVHSVNELVDAVEGIMHHPANLPRGYPLWYRGQRNANWGVQPALWRRQSTNRSYGLPDERNFTHRFRTRAATRHLNTPSYEEHAAWLSLMQHYGLPTRLLDWSRSPLIAAYFAVHSGRVAASTDEDDAAIWVLSPHELNLRSTASHVTPALDSGICKHLVTPAFRDLDGANQRGRGSVIAAMATETDVRMFVQQGCFTVHSPDADPLQRSDLTEGLIWKLVIPRGSVPRFARQLDNLGFRQGDLFPDLEHLATELVDTYPPGSVIGMKQ